MCFKIRQAPITKRFVHKLQKLRIQNKRLSILLEDYPDRKVLNLALLGTTTEQPIISKLIRNFDVEVNIVQGKISHTQNGSYGTLFIHIDGAMKKSFKKQSNLLMHSRVRTEVIDTCLSNYFRMLTGK